MLDALLHMALPACSCLVGSTAPAAQLCAAAAARGARHRQQAPVQQRLRAAAAVPPAAAAALQLPAPARQSSQGWAAPTLAQLPSSFAAHGLCSSSSSSSSSRLAPLRSPWQLARLQPTRPAATAAAAGRPAAVAVGAAGGAAESGKVEGRLTHVPDDVLVVDTPAAARQVVQQLLDAAQQGVTWTDAHGMQRHEQVFFACGTEVAGIDVKTQTPVRHGAVICFSIYGGPWLDFGPGAAGSSSSGASMQQPRPKKSRIWVDLAAGYDRQLQQLRDGAAAAEAAAAALAASQPTAPAAGGVGAAGSRRRRRSPAVDTDAGAPADDAVPAAASAAVQGLSQLAAHAGSSSSSSAVAAAKPLPGAVVFGDGLPPPSVADIQRDPDAAGIIAEFARFFSDASVRKVWHNYGFDRHVLERMGFEMHGFAADTLHMARLYDASRKQGYSLESLSSDRPLMANLKAELGDEATLSKRGMKERFGLLRCKPDGSSIREVQLPGMHVLQFTPEFRADWIDYSALDAKATWNVHRVLRAGLDRELAIFDEYLCSKLAPFHPQLAAAKEQAAGAQQQQQQQEQEQQQPAPVPARRPTPRPRRSLRSAAAAQLPLLPQKTGAGYRSNAGSGSNAGSIGGNAHTSYTMLQLYEEYWKPFGELLTEMEKEGVRVNRDHLQEQQVQAIKDQQAAEQQFRDWAAKYVPGAVHMNVNSQVQIRQLLFPDSCPTPTKKFKAENPAYDPAAKPRPRRWIDFELHGLWGPRQPGRLAAGAKTDTGLPAVRTEALWSMAGKPGAARKALQLAALGAAASTAVADDDSPDALLQLDSSIDDALDEDEAAGGAAAGAVTLLPGAGLTAADLARLNAEAEELRVGKMYAAMGGGAAGLEACAALEQLIQVWDIEMWLKSYLEPLQADGIITQRILQPGERSGAGSQPVTVQRVHCSLNLNTEIGRISARRPNLQNQPTHDKDRYKVRKAFTAEPGKLLVVADYGQIELRLLAHMANCKSMLEAFELGGDFHSRTALGMYDHIKDAIAAGECLLEWDSADGPPPAPLLKDKFASERRVAKVLNCSIAYGKIAQSVMKDRSLSEADAHELEERWYADRPEVREWRASTRAHAAKEGWVNTMIGRRRSLLDIASPLRRLRAHSQRAALSTPLQGSVADVVTAAMLSIARDEWLRSNGWKLLLQVHDEVMLEGPEESAEEARQRVVACMANPWDNLLGFKGQPLRVELAVDANIAPTWYEAK